MLSVVTSLAYNSAILRTTDAQGLRSGQSGRSSEAGLTWIKSTLMIRLHTRKQPWLTPAVHPHSDGPAGQSSGEVGRYHIETAPRPAAPRERVSWLLSPGGMPAPGRMRSRHRTLCAFAGNPDRFHTIRALNSPRCASSNALNTGAAAACCFTAVPGLRDRRPS
jgi:hypothetical protein